MTMTGLDTFDATVQKTIPWINELGKELGWENKHQVFQGLRATLHALRDRLTVEEAAHLGAQLPILLGGFYYENWRPGAKQTKDRTKEEFLQHIRDYFRNVNADIDPETLVRAVFKVMAQRVSQGEIEDVIHMMPPALRELWPEAVRT
ncbi:MULTISPECIES: DUF2267 domain-containing protein [Sphaerospermopsis]|jgi:uncharacterized protein (DUF2267 family)|uniref:DUF2267 domain-containing protein n=1 Tax=Sphaerospermopsis torques-reginae ITEP-024 TaxID=984208 RepID=A0ABX8WYV7_9CYAN|nr:MULTISPECIES: DUF2267 domain-containing protein [Sphaerospermopsis]MBE9055860.1 DUF2267 domain-containing protein [Sphaerospermopsis sp. LEGE 08334]QYX31616.1 DUF2267 domain-containing protein [Sphaerospermopsis torques-reginae ITEP-024]